jgi:uncharacterized membrane protein
MKVKGLILATSIGCGIGYLFDPRSGRRRRAIARDKLVRARRRTTETAGKVGRDLRNRAHGILARARRPASDVPDEVLHDQVRSRLGRVVSHPAAIHVVASEGTVRLTGPILEDEVDSLLGELSSIRGIRSLEDNLEVYGYPGNISSLQGVGSSRPIAAWKRDTWPQGLRLLAGFAGGALVLAALGRGRIAKAALAGSGAALLLRSAFNVPWSRIVGIGAGRTAVDVRKTIYVDSPVEEVFDLWSNPENLPRLFEHVKEVRRTERPDEYLFTVSGPGGVPVEWTARVTKLEPNRLIGWKTVSDSLIKNAGKVEFWPENGGTRVNVHLKYNPGIGALGDAAAKMLGADAKTLMDEDLARMKNTLEGGRAQPEGSV